MTLSPKSVADCLHRAGIEADASSIQLDSRKGRTVVRIDSDRIAWFPEHQEGRAAIANERRLLRLIERYCRFRAPRVLYEDADGWDVRAMVPGVPDMNFLTQVRNDPATARRTGAAIGRILADQHTRIPTFELAGWLNRVPPWPLPSSIENLPKVVADTGLLLRIERALERWRENHRIASDPVLVHGDLGPWNIAVNPVTGDIEGLFDYGDASFGDRHQDFKYMTFQRPDEQTMLDAAIEAYEDASGIELDRLRIRFFNAIEAIGFLGFRFGHAPEEPWCGRTLAEDIEWTTAALDSVEEYIHRRMAHV